jgi:hypothetical protein
VRFSNLFKKSALLSSRALFSFQIASRVGAVQGLFFQAGVKAATFPALK